MIVNFINVIACEVSLSKGTPRWALVDKTAHFFLEDRVLHLYLFNDQHDLLSSLLELLVESTAAQCKRIPRLLIELLNGARLGLRVLAITCDFAERPKNLLELIVHAEDSLFQPCVFFVETSHLLTLVRVLLRHQLAQLGLQIADLGF